MTQKRGRPATVEGSWNSLVKALILVEKSLKTFQNRYIGTEEIEAPANIIRAMQSTGRGKLYHVIPDLISYTAYDGFSNLLIKKEK